ncbi:sorbitol dehydrogenase family protein [Frateuria aurantia]
MSQERKPPASLPNVARRRFMGGTVLSVVAGNLGLEWSERAEAAEAAPATVDLPPQFLPVSAQLTGVDELSRPVAERLYTALVAEDAGFSAALKVLADFIQTAGGVEDLQSRLDSAQSAVAALPRKIVTAWYTGIVGDGIHARCIAYEDTLMNSTVADHLQPQSYSLGNYGAWAQKPA